MEIFGKPAGVKKDCVVAGNGYQATAQTSSWLCTGKTSTFPYDQF